MTIRMTTKFGLAVLTAATLSGAAIAQEAGTDTRSPSIPDEPAATAPENETSLPGGGIAAGPSTTADLASDAPKSYGQLISSLYNADLAMADVDTLASATEVQTRRLSDLDGQAKESKVALQDALTEATPQLDALRAGLADNDSVTRTLEAEGLTPEKVIGVYETADGAVELLLDDRA